MADKAHSKLIHTDRVVRETISATREGSWGEDGTLMTIEFISGFELFNTRPYHNYEAWGDGWRITGRGVTVEREDLDDALAAWHCAVFEAYAQQREEPSA